MKNSPANASPSNPTSPPFRKALLYATTAPLLFSLGYIAGILSPSVSKPQTLTHPFTNPTVPQSPQLNDLLSFRTNCATPIPHDQILPTLLHRIYNNASPYTNFPSPETANLLLPAAAQPRGWGSTNPVFSDLISSLRPLTIIELGTFLGASALHMASLTRNQSLPSLILCLDDFRGWPAFRSRFTRHVPAPRHADSLLLHQFMIGVAAAGETGRVFPVPFSTSSALAAFCEWGIYGDLIEVDAGHDFQSAWSDINKAYAVLRTGGVLFGHDYYTAADNHGVRRAVSLFARVKGIGVRPHGEHWVLDPKPSGSVSD